MFQEAQCDLCGECLTRCPELCLSPADAKAEIQRLIRSEGSPSTLYRCSSCFSCNLYCPRDCGPYDLILSRWQQRYDRVGSPPIWKFICPNETSNLWSTLHAILPEGARATIEGWMTTEPSETVFLPGSFFPKLYDRKNALVAADMLNDRVLPFFEAHDIPLLRVLTDRGTEYCGAREHHEYQLYLAVEDIDHSRTKARSPQSNGICERFHKTVLQEFYQVAFRKKIYNTLDELQADLDNWLDEYNQSRPHSGKYCFGKTPMQTFLDSLPLAKEKVLNKTVQTVADVA